ncbi:MAG: VanZ family protein [Candidatus Omnitrophica bacterium]|nr:VanZ family protein [Candidatus Omnitrophota bacterium]
MAIISYISSVPGDNLPDLGIAGVDKFAHFSEYLVMGILLTRALFGQNLKINLFRAVILSIIIAVFYAAIDEWHQVFIPGRQADILDFAADVAGITLGSMLYLRRYLGAKNKTV